MKSKPPIAGSNGYLARPAILGLAKVLFAGLSQVPYVSAAPVTQFLGITKEMEGLSKDSEDPSLWLYLGVAAVLVLLGGAFAGLTIALMGQDSIYLQVIATSGEGKEQKHADKVLTLLKRGKHWVLVTLLLANVMVNESLPIVLDRSLGGGWPAVVGSTALIVIFGEVIPQAVCVRYGLAIGAFMQPFVVTLMWLLAPIAWPTAQLLDWALGEDHGTTYKKSGLKTLVTLHKTLGSSPTDRLNQDEVTIISAVLDLKDKAVGDIMTPMEDVFTMSADTILDEHTMNIILSAGYSRIPIYEPGNEGNFVGMLLVKILITYDPEDCKKVSAFALATLPETRAETSCLDIVNFFQEGKSHMVLVSEYPGENYGAIGVVTLEDVIEELIGEEIIDESDVFIDIHKAIRRVTPAPKARMQKTHVVGSTDASSLHAPEDLLIDLTDGQRPEITTAISHGQSRSNSPAHFGTSPKTTFLRRGSSGADGRNISVRGNFNDMREHLKHLGPSNLASRPKTTRYNTVKIKSASHPLRSESRTDSTTPHEYIVEEPYHDDPAPFGGEGEGLLKSAGKEASDGVQAIQQGYGSFDPTTPPNPSKLAKSETTYQDGTADAKPSPTDRSSPSSQMIPFSRNGTAHSESSDTVGSLKSGRSLNKRKKATTRSGSITENIIEAGGIRKVVLETTSSSSDKEDGQGSNKGKENIFPSSRSRLGSQLDGADDHDEATAAETKGEEVKKKRRRTRHKKKGGKNSEEGSTAGQ
ncbi:Protein MAM3 [Lachnellula arida]|uniref:Protein MAM3 n=1 Tax=Lachnellula arida TaxID=1316785 RepID=A0A8T9BKG4_9HELO|nr:Protein MAM3 [Lachnellula arida]